MSSQSLTLPQWKEKVYSEIDSLAIDHKLTIQKRDWLKSRLGDWTPYDEDHFEERHGNTFSSPSVKFVDANIGSVEFRIMTTINPDGSKPYDHPLILQASSNGAYNRSCMIDTSHEDPASAVAILLPTQGEWVAYNDWDNAVRTQIGGWGKGVGLTGVEVGAWQQSFTKRYDRHLEREPYRDRTATYAISKACYSKFSPKTYRNNSPKTFHVLTMQTIVRSRDGEQRSDEIVLRARVLTRDV